MLAQLEAAHEPLRPGEVHQSRGHELAGLVRVAPLGAPGSGETPALTLVEWVEECLPDRDPWRVCGDLLSAVASGELRVEAPVDGSSTEAHRETRLVLDLTWGGPGHALAWVGRATSPIRQSVIHDHSARAPADDLRRAPESSLLRAVVDHMPGMVGYWDTSETYRFANQAYLEWFGWSADDVIGRTCRDVLGEELYALNRPALRRALEGEAQRFERRIVKPGGQETHMLTHYTPHIVGNVVAGVVAAVFDVSDLRAAQKELERQAEALVRSNAELDQFAAVASHDLQEPLRKVSSYMQVLVYDYGERLDERALEYIAFAVDGATRMRKMITDLLAVSQLRSGTMQVASCDVAVVVAEVLKDFEMALSECAAVVEVGAMPLVQGDRAHLRQVFSNLVSNAVKYRSDRPLRIQIEAGRDGLSWRFTLQDNGIGFRQEHAKKVFMMFTRLVTRRDYDGTGIGLAVVAKVVQNHGGDVWATSEPGAGTAISFTFPGIAD